MMSITANNMANANTDGFKASSASFQELLHQRVRMPDDYENRREYYDRNNAYNTRNWNRGAAAVYDEEGEEIYVSRPGDYFTENKLRIGAGSRVNENAMLMTNGSLIFTEDPLTAALTNPRAFYAVMNSDGEVAYTRGSTFSLSNEEDGIFLINTNGEYVLDENYDYIMLPEDANRDEIIFAPHNAPDNNELIVRLGIFTFNNLYGLEHLGGNKFIPTDLSGEAEVMENPVDIIRQYHIEASNVSIADEMVKVIQAQRAFQSNLTTIRTADEIEAYINQLRG
jgi:flagellar basal-body rod protein FlgG